MTVFNLGSINVDMVVRVPHLPRPGETLAAIGSNSGLGGKGANQSVAVAKANHTVMHIGTIGEDGFLARNELADYGVDVQHVGRMDGPTGRAVVMVAPDAENSIIILPGTNLFQSESRIRAALEDAQEGDTLLLQNETSHQEFAARHAHSRGLRVIYSAAPFSVDAVGAVMPYVSVLLMNEVESEQLVAALGKSLEELTVPHLIVTRGAAGATLYDTKQGTSQNFPSLQVEPVDTTGAGDTFAGFLAAGLDQGFPWEPSMMVALSGAALSTTAPGAAQSIPEIIDVKKAIYRQFGVRLPGVTLD